MAGKKPRHCAPWRCFLKWLNDSKTPIPVKSGKSSTTPVRPNAKSPRKWSRSSHIGMMRHERGYKMCWRRIIFSTVAAISIGAAGYFSFWVEAFDYAMTGIWLTFSLFAIAFGWPEVAESISFLGNSIKMRDIKKLESDLKAIVQSLAQITSEAIQASGRLGGGISLERKQQFREEIEHSLRDSGFNENEIKEVFSGWNRWILHDYAMKIQQYTEMVNKDTTNPWKNGALRTARLP